MQSPCLKKMQKSRYLGVETDTHQSHIPPWLTHTLCLKFVAQYAAATWGYLCSGNGKLHVMCGWRPTTLVVAVSPLLWGFSYRGVWLHQSHACSQRQPSMQVIGEQKNSFGFLSASSRASFFTSNYSTYSFCLKGGTALGANFHSMPYGRGHGLQLPTLIKVVVKVNGRASWLWFHTYLPP